MKTEAYDVGVLVGRFQVPDLHDGHLELIDHVLDNHGKVIIVLGASPLPNTLSNPLDIPARRQMIHEVYPDVEVAYIMDVNNDTAWSRALDKLVGHLITPNQTAVFYGSRDSFIPHYNGIYPVIELESSRYLSGTAVRKQIQASSTRNSEDFRAGVVWAASARFPTSFATVDVAIWDASGERFLFGRKANESNYRFVGGFSDPSSPSYEVDARREVMEETGIVIEDISYVGSTVIDDWRYRSEVDCIKTMLFLGHYTHGRPLAADDLEEVRWFDEFGLAKMPIVPEHAGLLGMLNNYLETK